jgi:isopentenyl diphosphate isomerase/L-lactate dehydrogenase-like FMN-dependent dehydrogenase
MAGDPVCIDDFEKHAQEFLPKRVWNYYYSGANAQQSREDCENAFKRYRERTGY